VESGNRLGGDSMSKPKEEPEWRRATRCASGTCVEVARVADRFLIRDSKSLDGPTLTFTEDEWKVFTQAVKQDEFQFE
jgi:hypothetical protein